jgi:hypothetical protein
MGTLVRNPLHAPDRQNRSRPDAAGNGEQKGPARGPRFAHTTIGFWVGGGLLGTGGCILGVCMPYHYPVAVVISGLWWGIYLGCLGGSVGALIGLLTERAPAASSRGSDGAGTPPRGGDSRAFPAGARGIIIDGESTDARHKGEIDLAKIELEYREQKADGSLGAALKTGYCVKSNKRV